jgi:hypothetical protein
MVSIYLKNPAVGNRVACGLLSWIGLEKVSYFCRSKRSTIMGHDHDHHDHSEAEQNEIGGPVVLALFLFVIVITTIYFLS